MNPTGKVTSFLTFPSMAIFPSLDFTINLASLPFKANFNLFLRRILRGIHSLNLCGPQDGFGAYFKHISYENSSKFAKHPMLRGINSLQMFLWTSFGLNLFF
jgi:hypothetical protein